MKDRINVAVAAMGIAIAVQLCWMGCTTPKSKPRPPASVTQSPPQTERAAREREPAYDLSPIPRTPAAPEPEATAGLLSPAPSGFGRPISDREAWGKLAAVEGFAKVVEKAEQFLKEPLPETSDELYLDFSKTGNRTRWQRVNFKRRGRLAPLVLAECLENKGRFVSAIEDLVRAVCAEKTWVMPAHDGRLRCFRGETIEIDLASSSLGWQLAQADYLLRDRLSPDIRTLTRDCVDRQIFQPYRAMVDGKRKLMWWMKTTNNWNAVCLAGVTGAALSLLDSPEDRAYFIAAAQEYSKNFLKGFSADGYCSEGLGYWGYGFGRYLLLSEAVYQATNGAIDMLARPEAREPAMFAARAEIINSNYPIFADCSRRAKPSVRHMNFVSRRFGTGLTRWEEKERISYDGTLYEALMYSFPNSATRTPPAVKPAMSLGLRTWFNDAGILVCRPPENATPAFGAALKGGHNAEHHNHNDVGSYVVVVGKESLLVDPGGETYTARTFSSRRYESDVLNSYGHPVPFVAGKLQHKGRDAKARVVKTTFTDAEDTLILDLADAYTVPALTKLERTFVYSRSGAGGLTIADNVAFKEPSTFGTALITYGGWKEIKHGELIVYGMDQAVRVQIQSEGAEFTIVEETMKDGGKPTRLGINLTAPVTAGSITTTVTPTTFGEDNSRFGLVRNGGFEFERWGWSIPGGSISTLSTEQAAAGETSLKINDDAKDKGSNVTSGMMAVDPKQTYELRGNAFIQSGDGVGLYIRAYDKDGTNVDKKDDRGNTSPVGSLGAGKPVWTPFAFRFTVPPETASVRIWIHSYNAAKVTAFLDDLAIVEAE